MAGLTGPERSGRWDVLLMAVLRGLPLLLGVFYLLHSYFRFFDRDEFEAVHTAWKILHGQVAHADFFQHHHLAVHHLLAGLMAWTGQDLQALFIWRLAFLAMSAGIVWLTWLLAREIGGRDTALTAVTLLLGLELFGASAVEIRPDVPQVLCGLLGVWTALRGQREDRAWLSCLGGAGLALSFVFLQKAIVSIALIFGVQALAVWLVRARLRHLLLQTLALTLTLAPFGLHLWMTDAVADYVFWNWTLNLHFSCPDADWFFLRRSLLLNGPTWAFFAAGAWLALRRRDGLAVMASGLAVGLLASVAVYNVHYPQYFLFFLPLMAIVAAWGLHGLVRRPAMLAAILVLACAGGLGRLGHDLATRGNAAQLAKVANVLHGSDPADLVYDGNAEFNLFRGDVDYFWFSVRPECSGLAAYQSLKEYPYDIVERVRALRPRVVSTYLLGDGVRELDGYRPSEAYPDLLWRADEGGTGRDTD